MFVLCNGDIATGIVTYNTTAISQHPDRNRITNQFVNNLQVNSPISNPNKSKLNFSWLLQHFPFRNVVF